jgi:hypothetical protein
MYLVPVLRAIAGQKVLLSYIIFSVVVIGILIALPRVPWTTNAMGMIIIVSYFGIGFLSVVVTALYGIIAMSFRWRLSPRVRAAGGWLCPRCMYPIEPPDAAGRTPEVCPECGLREGIANAPDIWRKAGCF